MHSQIVEIPATQWQLSATDPTWIEALEQGKVLYFPTLPFELSTAEQRLLTPEVLDAKVRNISLAANNQLKGAAGDEATQQLLTRMLERYRGCDPELAEETVRAWKADSVPAVVGRWGGRSAETPSTAENSKLRAS